MNAASGFAVKGLAEAALLHLALGGPFSGGEVVSDEGEEFEVGDV